MVAAMIYVVRKRSEFYAAPRFGQAKRQTKMRPQSVRRRFSATVVQKKIAMAISPQEIHGPSTGFQHLFMRVGPHPHAQLTLSRV